MAGEPLSQLVDFQRAANASARPHWQDFHDLALELESPASATVTAVAGVAATVVAPGAPASATAVAGVVATVVASGAGDHGDHAGRVLCVQRRHPLQQPCG
jgi:hypothetical protein